MDPDKCLDEALEVAREIVDALDGSEPYDIDDAANTLAERVIALDEWLRKGGFLPKPWARGFVHGYEPTVEDSHE